MNLMMINGRIFNIPKVSFVQSEHEKIYVCTFAVAVKDAIVNYGEESEDGKADYFLCLATGDVAKSVNDNFGEYSKVLVRGRMKNYIYTDCNGTGHFTQVLHVESIEAGDTKSEISSLKSKKGKFLDQSVTSDLVQMKKEYDFLCKNNYLCIDEDFYYKIATSNL